MASPFEPASLEPACAVTGTFLDEFQEEYQRNNKRTGQKNIRCFPTHCEQGHETKGFCGRSLTVEMQGVTKPDIMHTLHAWGEFILVEKDGTSKAGLQLFERVSCEQVEDLERSRERPFEPWLRGEISLDPNKDDCIKVEFNKYNLGWHYGWMGSKHTSDQYHAFAAYLFLKEPEKETLLCIGRILSPSFKLHSRRRVDPNEKEEAKTSVKRSRDADATFESLVQPDASVVKKQCSHDESENSVRLKLEETGAKVNQFADSVHDHIVLFSSA